MEANAVPQQPVSTSAPLDDAPDYTAEVRFGIVMYGGVSLAIYINGVTNEIFEMACATPRDGIRIDRAGEPVTRGIYRRLSWLVGNTQLRADYAKAIRQAATAGDDPVDVWSAMDTSPCTQTRFAVDVVAGTSAGGINGLFLAKALANGERFAALKELWVNEGDIALLLNDEKSYANVEPALKRRDSKPASLLNSDRMYAKLHYALGQMTPLDGVSGIVPDEGTSPLVDEIDLYITTTDIKGTPVPLRLFDKIVYERRYKQNYHFAYPNGLTEPGGNDFDAVNKPFLAFAARCTSSFPFAFEPMTLSTLTRLDVAGAAPGVKRWNAFFPNLSRVEVEKGLHVDRAFGDGGYLDNKPFTYVVDVLSRRFSSVPLERKLIFVEPSPEQIDLEESDDAEHPQGRLDDERSPDALQNSLAALTKIPQYETIREDLQAVLARNRRIERIERVVRLNELAVKVAEPFGLKTDGDGKLPDWSTLKLSEMAAYYGTAFLSYQRLRVYAVTDAIADRLGAHWGIDGDSDKQYALRALVRVWRERSFDDEGRNGKQTINAFLDEFDLDYRVRRLGFVLRKIDRLTRLVHKRAAGPLDTGPGTADTPPALSEEELQMLGALPEPFRMLPAALPLSRVRDAENVLRSLKRGLHEARARLLKAERAALMPQLVSEPMAALRVDLDTILLQILGRTPSDRQAEVGAPGSGKVRLDLGSEPSRLASASRTLQESVTFRARALFAVADRNAVTPIQDRLIRDIESLRVKRSGKDAAGPDPELCKACNAAWQLLGRPELVPDPTSQSVDVQVGAVTNDGLHESLVGQLPSLNADDGTVLRRFLGLYYLRFDTFDQMSFPLYYDTGTGEPSTVEVVRISPVDATNLINEKTDKDGRKKLAGTALANFGAFLDRRWRLNDIMWGQLDGAERLIEALLPMGDDDTRVVRKELIERAHRSILRDALIPEGHAELADLVIKALDRTAGRGTEADRLHALFSDLWTGNTVARANMANVLVSLLGEQGLMDFVRRSRKTDPNADPEATLKSAARAVTITGRVLSVISTTHGAGATPSRWLARLGLMMQGIVAVSLPGTLNQRWWTHGVKVMYAFEVVLVVFAFLFGNSDMRTLAVMAFATTIGIHLLTLIAGDLMRESKRALYVSVMALLVALVGLAAVGTLTLVHQGAQQQMCWVRPGDAASSGAASWTCAQVGRLRRWWSGDAAPVETR